MRNIRWEYVLGIIAVILLGGWGVLSYKENLDERKSRELISELRSKQELVLESKDSSKTEQPDSSEAEEPAKVVVSYDKIFAQNDDMVAWLKIPGTDIDYPVMQTFADEEFYLYRNFNKEKDKNGCLILDTDSDLTQTSNNLIIHGHNMKSGAMFGKLTEYADETYGKEHNMLYFTTRSEKRTYEIISVFYSQVYRQDENVFKFYKFFKADTEEEFNDFYNNIKKLSVYDTGISASFGDEFITLTTCAYHVDNGRFVVVGKRVE